MKNIYNYSEERILTEQAERLRSMINSGVGITNKPISGKRIAKLKRNLKEIESALNALTNEQEDFYNPLDDADDPNTFGYGGYKGYGK